MRTRRWARWWLPSNWRPLAIPADELRTPAAAFLAHLVLVFTVAVAAVASLDYPQPVQAGNFVPAPMRGLPSYLIAPLSNWDGVWYTRVAEMGYGEDPATTAFWPLYPLLLRLGHLLTGWRVEVIGVALSNVAFLAALVLIYRLVSIDYGAPAAARTVWLLALFPTSFYFSAVYTESLFLLLSVAAVYSGRVERWGAASLCGLLAALTRNTGVLLLIPLGLFLIHRHGWSARRWWKPGIPISLVGAAPLLFLGYVDAVWGNPRLPVDVQSLPMWARTYAPPWETLITGLENADVGWLGSLLAHPSWETLTSEETRRALMGSQIVELASAVGFLLVAPYMVWRVRPAYSLYALVAFTVPLLSPSHFNPLFGVPRFVIVLFPFFIALALLLRNRWLFIGWLVVSTVLLAALVVEFSTGFFVA